MLPRMETVWNKPRLCIRFAAIRAVFRGNPDFGMALAQTSVYHGRMVLLNIWTGIRRVSAWLAGPLAFGLLMALTGATAVFCQPASPSVTLIGKAVVPPEADSQPDSKPAAKSKPTFTIKLGSADDLLLSDALLFSLKSEQPFPSTGQIEIASPDGPLHATLSVARDTLILEDAHSILAKLEPLKAFGASAHGPIRLRAVMPDGAAGDWLPLVTLVRVPTLTGLSCPAGRQLPCTLTGEGLKLIDSLAADAAFTNPTRVSDGFMGSSLKVLPPTGALYYVRLRDDPAVIDTVTLPGGAF